MKLPPDVQFDEKVRLFIWRPHGLIDESAVNRIITILGEMEADPLLHWSGQNEMWPAIQGPPVAQRRVVEPLGEAPRPMQASASSVRERNIRYSPRAKRMFGQGVPSNERNIDA
jgi:hypothetical protein